MAIKKNLKKRRSVERAKKMRSHIQELGCFFNQRIGALENMLDDYIAEEQTIERKEDK